ncbi:MAG: glycosyltransferase family 4 protein [Burkholderiaceae bacterium]
MRIAYVNCDHGIALGAAKGATTHIVELVRAMTDEEAALHVLSARVESIPPGLVDVPVIALDEAAGIDARKSKEQARREQSQMMFERLLELHRRWPFDAIYERYSLWSDAGVRAARRLDVPVLMEVNAPLVREQLAYRRLVDVELAAEIERRVFDQADHLFVVSGALRTWLLGKGVEAGRVSVLGNGVDHDMFSPGSDLRKHANTIGFTGSLKHWHGIFELLQAFRSLHHLRPDTRLLIVGDGPKRDWIDGFVQGADIADAVTVTGWVAHHALPELIGQMDIAVAPYPAAEDFYFSPLKLFEYMAMGRPIVASRIGQVAEVLEHDRNAWLTTPGDPDRLADAFAHLLDEHDLRTRLGAAARIASAEHSWRRNAQRVLARAMDLRSRTGASAC